MKKKVLLLLLIMIIAAGSTGAGVGYPAAMPDQDMLIYSFESCNAKVMESTISAWGKLNNRFMDIDEIQKEMAVFTGRMGFAPRDSETAEETDEQVNKQTVYAEDGNKIYSIVLESVKKGSKGESYIIIDVTMDKSYAELEAEKKKLDGVFRETIGTLKYSRCIIGTYDGKLGEKEMGRKTRIALNAINAKRIEGIENEEMSSISAFSSRMDGYILSNDKKVNIQVALRYSAYDDKTYIWVGTPLIPIEY